MSRSKGKLFVDEVGYVLVDRNQVNADPVNAHASAVREALRNMAVPQSHLVCALPGQTVVIRYPRLPESARDNIDTAVEQEAGQNIPYDLAEVILDYDVLEEIDEGDQKQLKVLLVAAKHEIIESKMQILEAADLQCAVLGVDSLAIADAAEGCDFLRVGETVAIVNIGLTSASIHFIKDGVSNFIRDVNWGARELIQAVAKKYHCDYEEAERRVQGDFEEPTEEQPQQEPIQDAPQAGAVVDEFGEPPAADPFASPGADPFAAPSSDAPAADDPFAEAPADDPFAAPAESGGSQLDPLNDGDPSGASDQMAASAAQPENGGLQEVLSTSLTRLISEVRRSFDYYEHQLYENPVDRLILCGGVAHLPIITETMSAELGLESLEVADPSQSALILGDDVAVQELVEHAPQFMVAIGLAARGMADL